MLGVTTAKLDAGLLRTLSSDAIVDFYERKTDTIISRYGPGPRVHYHTGILETSPWPGASREELRSNLLISQERLLKYASELWCIRRVPFREVIDIGCGLGGGSIFWAQEFGAEVTAVTIAPSHIDLIAAYAKEACVGSLVRPLLCDAAAVPGKALYDAAVAIDSTSSFARRPWFQTLHRLLRENGHVFIFDCFLGRAEYEEPFNRHWCAQIGSIDEYLAAANEANFQVNQIEDISSRAFHFWSTTAALIRKETAEDGQRHCEREESSRIHSLVQEALTNGGLKHVLMSFVRQ